jgi:hypothetical protein
MWSGLCVCETRILRGYLHTNSQFVLGWRKITEVLLELAGDTVYSSQQPSSQAHKPSDSSCKCTRLKSRKQTCIVRMLLYFLALDE